MNAWTTAKTEQALAATQELRSKNITHCLFGGAAAQFHGCKRPITDIDFYVHLPGKAALKAIITSYDSEKTTTITRNNVEFCASPIRIGDRKKGQVWSMDEQALKRCILHEGLPIIAREDLVLIKAALNRGRDKGKFDLPDIQEIAAIKPQLDFSYLAFRLKVCNLPDCILSRIRLAGFTGT